MIGFKNFSIVMLSQNILSSFFLICWYFKIECVHKLWQNRLFQNEKEHLIVKIRIDRESKFDDAYAVDRLKNHVLHSRSKHIDIRHHFICDLVENKVVFLKYVPIEGQNADILTKPLDVSRFESLRKSIGLCTLSWLPLELV